MCQDNPNNKNKRRGRDVEGVGGEGEEGVRIGLALDSTLVTC